MSEYDPADDSLKSFNAAIAAKKARGDTHDWKSVTPGEYSRKARGDGTTEHQIHSAIIQWLDRVLPKTIRYQGVSNNPRSPMAGAREKARGMRKGFPDIILTGAFHGFIEVKMEGSYLRPEQKEWKQFLDDNGVPHVVARSIEDVREWLSDYGVRTREA